MINLPFREELIRAHPPLGHLKHSHPWAKQARAQVRSVELICWTTRVNATVGSGFLEVSKALEAWKGFS